MWAPSGQFFRLLKGAPQISFFVYYLGAPSYLLLCLLYGAPQVTFFAYYMGPHSGQFLRLLYGGSPQVSFFAYYIGGPLRSVSSITIGGPLSSVSSHMGAPSDYFLRLLYGSPLGSISSLTIWQGRPQDLVRGGQEFFFRFGNLHVAKPCAWLGGFGGMAPRKFFGEMVQFGAFWCVF